MSIRRLCSSMTKVSPLMHVGLLQKSTPLCARQFFSSRENQSTKQTVGNDPTWTWIKRAGMLGMLVGSGLIAWKVLDGESECATTYSTYVGSEHSKGISIPTWFFSGRDTEMKEVETVLNQHSRAFIAGAPGVGKTQIALRYIAEAKGKYKNILYIPLDQVLDQDVALKHVADYLKSHVDESRLLVVDEINSKKDFESIYNTLRELRGNIHVMCVGRFSPIYFPYYKQPQGSQLRILGLKKEEVLNVIEKVKMVPDHGGQSADGMEQVQDSDGRYNPALLMSMMIRSGSLGVSSFDQILKWDPDTGLFGTSRSDYRPLGAIYSSIFKQLQGGIRSSIPGTESFRLYHMKRQVLQTFAKAPLGTKLTDEELKKMCGEEGYRGINELIELSLVERYLREQGGVFYSMNDHAFHRYIASHRAL